MGIYYENWENIRGLEEEDEGDGLEAYLALGVLEDLGIERGRNGGWTGS